MHQLRIRGGGFIGGLQVGLLMLGMNACSSTPTTQRQGAPIAGDGAAGATAGSGGGGTAGHAGAAGGGAGSSAGSGGGAAGSSAKPAFDAGSDPNRNAISAAQICERLSTIQCAGEEHCCDNPGRSRDACKSDMLGLCTNTLHLDAIAEDPITSFDAAAAQAAFTHFEGMAAQCDPGVTMWGVTTSGLRGILKGTRAPGADCTPQTTNVNDTAKIGAALASCTRIDTTACLPRAALAGLPLSWSCADKNAAGGACVTDVNCNDGLYCNNPQMSIGKCAARKAPGATCVNPNECASLFCKGKLCVASGVQPAYCLKN